MKVTIWGCRGSLAAPGRETVRYGGESTCLEILMDSGETIVIDAGSGIRKLGNKLLKQPEVTDLTMLFTHAHWDHLAGFPFFKPAFFSRYSIRLCGGAEAQDSVLRSLQHQMEPPYFPVDMSATKAKFVTGCRCGCTDCGNRLSGISGTHTCESIPLNHPNGGRGFALSGADGKRFVFLTDNEIQFHHENGRSREEYVEFCRGADLLLHDAQYTDEEYARTKSWGHSTFRDAIDLAIDAGVRCLGLVHHDPDRTDDELDVLVRWCVDYVRERKSSLDCFACVDGMSLTV